MKIIGELAWSGMAGGGRPPSEERHDVCRNSEHCTDAALVMIDMVMSLASEFRRALDS